MIAGSETEMERSHTSISRHQAEESSGQESPQPSAPDPAAQPEQPANRKRVPSHLTGVPVVAAKLSVDPGRSPDDVDVIAGRSRPHHGSRHPAERRQQPSPPPPPAAAAAAAEAESQQLFLWRVAASRRVVAGAADHSPPAVAAAALAAEARPDTSASEAHTHKGDDDIFSIATL